jgi:hypothetical protein
VCHITICLSYLTRGAWIEITLKRLILILVVCLTPVLAFAKFAGVVSSVYSGISYTSEVRLTAETTILPSSAPLNAGARVEADFNGKQQIVYPLFFRMRLGVFFFDAGYGIVKEWSPCVLVTTGVALQLGQVSLVLRGGVFYLNSLYPCGEIGITIN